MITLLRRVRTVVSGNRDHAAEIGEIVMFLAFLRVKSCASRLRSDRCLLVFTRDHAAKTSENRDQ